MDWNFIFNIEDGQWHPENWPTTSDPDATVNHTYFFEGDPSWADNWPTDQQHAEIPAPAPPDPHPNAGESLHLVYPLPRSNPHLNTTKIPTQNPQEISEPSPTALNPPSQPSQSKSPLRDPSASPHDEGSPKKKRKHHRKTKVSPKEKRPRKKPAKAESSASSSQQQQQHHHHQPTRYTRSTLPPLQTTTSTSPSFSNPTTAATTATTTTPTTATNPIEITIDSPTGRVPHKAVEKKYRDGIKQMFRCLRLALPGGGGTSDPTSPELTVQDGRSSSPPNMTKAGVIGRAIEYIQQLEGEKAEAQRNYEAAVRENEGLKRRVAELEQGEHGGGGRQQGQQDFHGTGGGVFPGTFGGQGGSSSGQGFGMF